MNTVIYFAIAFTATFIGAIPLGTVNLFVINTTLKQNAQHAMKIALAAGAAEIILSLFALHCSTTFTKFIDMNQWIQITVALVLLLIGGFLFYKKQRTIETTDKKHYSSKLGTGFVLGLLNPPVVIYWVLAMSYIDMNLTPLNMNSPATTLFVFFLGVYFGKVGTLFLYSQLSTVIKRRMRNLVQHINKMMAVLLIVLSIVQLTKVLIT